jgi:hypothetical protein
MWILIEIGLPLIIFVDCACLIWGENCGVQGNCWVYDVDKLRYYVNLPMLGKYIIFRRRNLYLSMNFYLGCIFLGTLWDIGIWYHVGELPMYDDKDDKQNLPVVAKVVSDNVK